jgi:hypothetical protein
MGYRMIDIEEDDFTSLALFSLNWRWADPKWNQLPDNILSQIRPLREDKAQALWSQPLLLSSNADWLDQFVETDTSQDEQEVRHWLQQKSLIDNQQVVISWDKQTAGITTWNDFCYPSSDDVTIWPLSTDWVLRYYHSEVFSFGRRHV